MVSSALLPLTGNTQLFSYAKAITGLERPRRMELFKMPAFRKEFYALPEVQQDMLWQQLAFQQNGIPRDLVPRETMFHEFINVCRHPAQQHSDYFHNRAFELHCPHWYLREQLAILLEECLRSAGALIRGIAMSYTDPDSLRERKRIFYADSLSNDWCIFMRRMIISDLTDEAYDLWLEDKRFPLLMVHERNAAELRSRGIRISKEHARMLCHRKSITPKIAPTSPHRDEQAATAARMAELPAAQPTKTERQLDLFGDWSD